jgi:transcriptional regulator with XRE-family HTH domain
VPASREAEKSAVREALDVVAGITQANIARRLGVSVSLLQAVRNPARPMNRLGEERAKRLAQLLRADAQRLLAAADHLDGAR